MFDRPKQEIVKEIPSYEKKRIDFPNPSSEKLSVPNVKVEGEKGRKADRDV